jgi:ssDNA-binding replication factor A large subunit
LADETGTINMSLWNGQIDEVSVGDIVNIDGASVTRFAGALQLRIGKNGTMTVLR